MKKTFYILLLLTILSSCSKQNNSSSDKKFIYFFSQSKNKKLEHAERLRNVNSAFSLINESKIDSLSLAVIYQKVKIHFDLDHYDSIKHYNNLLLKHSKKLNNKYYTAKNHYINSYYYSLIELKKDSVFYHTNKAQEYFKQLNDSSSTGRMSMDNSRMYYESGDYHGSLQSNLVALEYLSKKKDKKYIASTYDIIASNYHKLKMYDKAIENEQKAMSLATTKSNQIIYQNNLATIYISLKKYDQAIKLLQSIITNSSKDTLHKELIKNNLNYTKWLQNPNLNIEKELLEILLERQKNKDLKGIANSYEYLADYFSQKDFLKSKAYADKLIIASKKLVYPEAELKALKIMMRINSQDTECRDRYIELKDSLSTTHLKTRNQYAKIKYDNSQALEENKTLTRKNEQEKLLKSLYALLTIISGIILLFYLYYSLQKRKQTHLKYEREKLNTVYKTETEISKKIHDEIANGIYQVMIHAQNESDSLSEKSLDKLDQIYKRTRNFSHQISEISVGENYLIELQGMLEDYQSKNTKIVLSGINSIRWSTVSEIKKETVYRVLNELMVNMKKHSQAHLVILKFTIQKSKIKIIYSDDGLGIPEKKLITGTGLKNVENRINSIQGSFNFENNAEQGIHISIVFPT